MFSSQTVNIKREMVLSPNDEGVASSKKHTQFKTRVHIPIPYFRTNLSKLIPYFRPKRLKNHTLWCRKYLCSLYEGVPPPDETALQLMSLAAYASEINKIIFKVREISVQKPEVQSTATVMHKRRIAKKNHDQMPNSNCVV